MFENFSLHKYHFDSKKGFIYLSFYCILAMGFLGYIHFSNTNNDDLKHFIKLAAIFLAFVYIVYLLYWVYRRFNYVYYSDKLHVIFAITTDYEDKELKKQYFELINYFNEQVKDNNLGDKIKIKNKPLDTKFSNHSAAEAKTKCNSYCSTLIISGLPITSINETKYKLNFHYEFAIPNKSRADEYKNKINKQIAKSMVNKNWTISNKLSSKIITFNGVFNVSTYILSLCSASLGLIDKSLNLLEPIRKEVNENVTNKEYGPLIAEIRGQLFEINTIKFNHAYWAMDLEKMTTIANELYRIDSYNYTTYKTLAIVHELQGNREKAKQYSEDAKLNSKKDNDYLFNDLYFNLDEGKYDDAIHNIDELIDKRKEYDIRFILRFLYRQYELKKKVTLLFNIGVVLILWGEKKLGRKELKRFMKETQNNSNSKMVKLVDKAIDLLK